MGLQASRKKKILDKIYRCTTRGKYFALAVTILKNKFFQEFATQNVYHHFQKTLAILIANVYFMNNYLLVIISIVNRVYKICTAPEKIHCNKLFKYLQICGFKTDFLQTVINFHAKLF